MNIIFFKQTYQFLSSNYEKKFISNNGKIKNETLIIYRVHQSNLTHAKFNLCTLWENNENVLASREHSFPFHHHLWKSAKIFPRLRKRYSSDSLLCNTWIVEKSREIFFVCIDAQAFVEVRCLSVWLPFPIFFFFFSEKKKKIDFHLTTSFKHPTLMHVTLVK